MPFPCELGWSVAAVRGGGFLYRSVQLPSVKGTVALEHYHPATRKLSSIGNGSHWPGKRDHQNFSAPSGEHGSPKGWLRDGLECDGAPGPSCQLAGSPPARATRSCTLRGRPAAPGPCGLGRAAGSPPDRLPQKGGLEKARVLHGIAVPSSLQGRRGPPTSCTCRAPGRKPLEVWVPRPWPRTSQLTAPHAACSLRNSRLNLALTLHEWALWGLLCTFWIGSLGVSCFSPALHLFIMSFLLPPWVVCSSLLAF